MRLVKKGYPNFTYIIIAYIKKIEENLIYIYIYIYIYQPKIKR